MFKVKENEINGKVLFYDSLTGDLQRSCDYKDNLPCGIYKEYENGKVIYETSYIHPQYVLKCTAERCVEDVFKPCS